MRCGPVIAFFLIVTLSMIGLTIFYAVKLSKTIEMGKDYVNTTCIVTNVVNEGLCDITSHSECYDKNDDIWWYNNWGYSPFINNGGIIYYSTSTTGYYDDDDDGEYDGDEDDGDGYYDDDDDDGGDGDTGDDDDGGDDDDDDDDDDGGGWDDGDDGGDDDEMVFESKLSKTAYSRQSQATSGAADLSNVREFKGKLKNKYNNKQKLLSQLNSNSTNNGSNNQTNSNGTNSNSNNNNDTSLSSSTNKYGSSSSFNHDSGCLNSGCYQGIFYVKYTVINNQTINSYMYGLVSIDSGWVDSYLKAYEINSAHACYYDSTKESNVLWFMPPKYKTSYLVATIIVGSIAAVSLIITLILSFIAYKRHHHHYHGYRSINH